MILFVEDMLMIHSVRSALSLLVLLLVSGGCLAQVQTGTPAFGSFAGGPDVINLANLNSHIDIPILAKPGRGMSFNYDLVYDSSVWYPVKSGSTTTWQPVFNWGWVAQTAVATGYISYHMAMLNCDTPPPIHQYYIFNNWVYYDPWGRSHKFYGEMEYDPTNCDNGNQLSLGSTALDGSGYALSATLRGLNVTTHTITLPNGLVFNAPLNLTGGYSGAAASATDRNGNQISVSSTSSTATFTDTLGTTALSVSGSGTSTSPMKFTYTSPSGGSPFYQVNYANYTVATNFGVSGIGEYKSSAAVPLVSSIVLPDNSQYSFTYESTPGSCTPYSGTTCVTARVKMITLPTGGTITYSYSGGNNGILSDGSTATLTRTVNPGGTWTYAQVKGSGAASTTTVTGPLGDVTTIYFQGIYETQRVVNQGSSTVLQTTNTCYNNASSPCTGTAITLPITQRNVSTQLPGTGNLTDMHKHTYGTYGNLLEEDVYDYGSGSYGALLAKTVITYALLGDITAFPQTITVTNALGATVSQTNYNYDQTGVVPTSGTPQHISVSASRGNLTGVNYYIQGSSYLTKSYTYFDTGNVQMATDTNGAQTNYAYGACGNSFPTSVNEPLNMSQSFTWDINCTGGVLTSTTDENSNTTTTTYNDPYFWRPASISYPDGGQTSWTYNSPTSTTTTVKMNSSQNIVSTVLLDGLGRTKETQLNSDPMGIDYVDTTYDSLGRIYTVTNPYRSGGNPTDGSITYGYDALNRSTSVTLQDGSVVSASYSGNTATVTDPAGKKRQSTFDSLGRLTSVTEDPGGLGYVTTYSYDPLGNILGVMENGGRQRTFAYDMLSRLTSETNPESGTANYYYDANGYSGDLTSRVAPAPNQTGGSTVTTTYTYDLLHRLTQKSYSDGTTLTGYFAYGQTSAWGNTLTNPIGRITEAWTGTSCCGTGGARIFGYDPMGRISLNTQYTPKLSYASVAYTYDLAGNTLAASNGVGITFSYAYDSASRPTQVTSSLVDSQHPATLAATDSSVGYYPSGQIRKMNFGDNLTLATEVESRLQPCQINLNSSSSLLTGCGVTPPSGTVQDLHYVFGSWGSTNNGSVTNWIASGTQNFNRSYSYDSLNRLSTMSAPGDSCSGLSWSYDSWGNRTDQTVVSGTCPAFHQTVNTQNRLVGPPYQYDAAGNSTYDGSHTYFYDAENRLVQVDGTFGTCSTATACYSYDALSQRVDKTTGSTSLDYVYNLDGQVMSEWCTNCAGYTGPTTEYIFLLNNFVAEYKNNTTYFVYSDHLGSPRILTGLNQAVVQNLDYLPFGELNSSDSGITTHKFTADERDAETGLDHTDFRQYSSAQGRWMTSDPAGLAAVDPTNPQSWNRYGYVLNEPLVLVDPTGACPPGYRPLSPDERAALVNAADPKNWKGWSFGMPSDLSNQQIDCSTFINLAAAKAGILIPWVGATNFGTTPTFSPISAGDLQPGDVIQFLTPGGTHSAIASSTGTNFNFIGSQTSTGPAPVNNWTANPYWNGQMYQTNPSKGATPTGYFEICVPIKPKSGKKGGGGSGGGGGVATGSGGQWLFWQPVLYGP